MKPKREGQGGQIPGYIQVRTIRVMGLMRTNPDKTPISYVSGDNDFFSGSKAIFFFSESVSLYEKSTNNLIYIYLLFTKY